MILDLGNGTKWKVTIKPEELEKKSQKNLHSNGSAEW